MKIAVVLRSVFALLLAFLVSSFVYFGFTNSYSTTLFSYEAFQQQFTSGIYQYRILSNYILSDIYELLGRYNLDYHLFKFKFLQAQSEPRMYLSFYIVNTIFLMLTALTTSWLMEIKTFCATAAEKTFIISSVVFALGLSQFVIVPYDMLSSFLLVLFFYVLIRYLIKTEISYLISLAALVILGTLTRESSALMLSLAATILIWKMGIRKETVTTLLVLIAVFITVYTGLRFQAHSFTTNDGNLLKQNLESPKNWLGLLGWFTLALMTLMTACDLNGRKLILFFHFFALPYLALCFYTGILYELRLYVPLFICSVLLGRLKLSKIR